jgi:DNA-binding CsgD family transcriptional regulator
MDVSHPKSIGTTRLRSISHRWPGRQASVRDNSGVHRSSASPPPPQPSVPDADVPTVALDEVPEPSGTADGWCHLALEALGASAWLVGDAGNAQLVAGTAHPSLPWSCWSDLAAETSRRSSEGTGSRNVQHVSVGAVVVSRTVVAVPGSRGVAPATLVVLRPNDGHRILRTGVDDDPTELRIAVDRWAGDRGVAPLSSRELDIVTLMVRGHRIGSIATMLFLSGHTVRNHLKSVFRKLDLHSQAELVDDFRRSSDTIGSNH